MRDFSLKAENIFLDWNVGGQKKGKCCEKTIWGVLGRGALCPSLARPTGISKNPRHLCGL